MHSVEAPSPPEPEKQELKKLSILIDKQFHTQLKRYVIEQDCTITELVLTLLQQHLNGQSNQLEPRPAQGSR